MPLTELRSQFRDLHRRGCFVIPNPWDVGSARYLESLGFRALATTSAGFAFSRGLADGAVPLDAALEHIRELAASISVPLNADFEAGYSDDAEGVGRNVTMCVEAGASGLSIEDRTGDSLYDFATAVERVKAARAAIDRTGSGALLTARSECFLVGHPEPLKESLRRLEAFAAAGADVLYAPGPRDKASVAAIVAAVHPKPVNILVGAPNDFTVAQLADLGVRRISVGSALARVAWGGFQRAARQLIEGGSFAGLADAAPYAELNSFFKA